MPLVWVPTETSDDPTTTVAAPGVLTDDDEVNVTDVATMPPVGYVGWALIEDEVVVVTGAAGNPYPIARAQSGTTSADHAAGASFNWIIVPETIIALVEERLGDLATQVELDVLIAAVADVLLGLATLDGSVVHNDPTNYPYELIMGAKQFADHTIIDRLGLGMSTATIDSPTPVGMETLQIWENTSGAPRNLQLGVLGSQATLIIQSASTSTSPITLTGEPGTTTSVPALTTLNAGDTALCWFNGGDEWKVIYLPGILDAELNQIANTTFSDDDVVQRKAGALTNRSLAQLRADLQALTGWVFAQAVTFTAAPQAPGGSTSVAGIGVAAANYGISKVSTSLHLLTNGTPALTVSPTVVAMGTGRTLQGTDAILSRLRLSTDYVRDGWAGQIYTAMPNTGTAMNIEVDVDPPSPSYYPRSAVINRGQANEEYIVCIAAPVFDSGTGLWTLSARRAMPFNSAVKYVHDPGETFEWTDNSNVMHGFVLPHLTGPGIVSMIQTYTADAHDPIQVFTPPRGTWNGWTAPLAGYLGGIAREALPSALQLLEPLNATVLGEIPANERGTVISNYNASAFDYYPFVATSHA